MKISYLALGDSYTKGESVPWKDNFPNTFKRIFEDSTQYKIDPIAIIAETGWTTTDLLSDLHSRSLCDTFDIVSLLIGVNNQYQEIPVNIYNKEFTELLQKAISLAGGDTSRVFVLSIPDYGATPFGAADAENIGKEIDQYNAINKSICNSLHITYFDITPISRQAKNDPGLVATDGLHPSAKMYKMWVDLFFNEVREKIKK